jgi:hypothetical protein
VLVFLGIFILFALLVGCASRQEAELFPTASECIDCHDDVTAPDGAHYSFVEEWFNSSHALSGRDPYFLATARSETLLLSPASDVIQETCAPCHLPMADIAAQVQESSRSFLDGSSRPTDPLYDLFADGTSCMFCHQLTEHPSEGALAFRGSMLYLDASISDGAVRPLYGYTVTDVPDRQAMIDALGYESAQDDAERKSLICTICHTLYIDTFDVDGNPTGTQLPEQVPFTEWVQSSLAELSCQSCHMPVTLEDGPLANGDATSTGRIGAHSFVGANSYLLELFENTDEGADYSGGIKTITDFLQDETATLDVSIQTAGSDLEVACTITNKVGHKFPTAFPSRRAWLHVTATDAQGTVIFESGGWDREGRIIGNDSDDSPLGFEPHYQVIETPDQVQIYESVMADSTGQVTTNLLQGVSYLKDNRLLPPGFDKQISPPDTAVIGDALTDEDFIGGQDTVMYRISMPAGTDAAGVRVTVELLYQSMGYRFIANLAEHPSDEQATFAEQVAQAPNVPLIVAHKDTKL